MEGSFFLGYPKKKRRSYKMVQKEYHVNLIFLVLEFCRRKVERGREERREWLYICGLVEEFDGPGLLR